MSQSTERRFVCRECGWRGNDEDALSASNPFDPGDIITGCPKCKNVNTMRTTCDELGCWEEDTCGTPTLGGYRRTCGKHQPIT